MKKTYGSDKNIFKKPTQQSNKLKTNGRWKNFQSSNDTTNDTTTNDTTTNFQTNSRFKNFDSSDKFENNSNFDSDKFESNSKFGSDKFERNSKFGSDKFERNSKFGSDKFESNSKFGERKYSKFGKKRIYKSRYKKEETLDYFKTQKNATQRDVSLFDFSISKNKKFKEKEEPKKKLQENMKCEMTKEEKNFIINKYMYEEETDSEEDENVIEKINDQTTKMIDF